MSLVKTRNKGRAVPDQPDGKIRWVRKDAFVMPVLPESLGIDPVVAAVLHLAAFVELSGSETVFDPEGATEVANEARRYLTRLPPERLASVRDQIERVAEHAKKQKWGRGPVAYFSWFAEVIDTDQK